MWRGAPLADLVGVELLQAEIRRLEELRLVAVMERNDADLALGAADELISELEELIAADPLRERLRGQFMLALYRAGRQTDALAVYREFSGTLRDELGLEPGRTLKELERSVLQQDPCLTQSRVSQRLRAWGTCRWRRPRSWGVRASWGDRRAHVPRRYALLTLTGAGGSGKTRLAFRRRRCAPGITRTGRGLWGLRTSPIRG